MAFFNFPFHVTKDTAAVASQVQTNFDSLLSWIMTNVIQKDGSVAMEAPLVMPGGPPATGDQAVNKSYVDAMIPIGTIWEYGGTTLPTKWLWCDGATYSNTQHSLLYGAIGRNFTATAVPGTNFQVPDKRGKFSMGVGPNDALGKGSTTAVGSRDSELFKHYHVIPEHGHTFTGSSNQVDLQHYHPVNITSGEAGQHGHNFGNGSAIWFNGGTGFGGLTPDVGGMNLATFVHDGNHTHGVNGFTGVNYFDGGRYHTHGVGSYTVNNRAAFNTNDTGTGTTGAEKNLPPYIALNYIIYAGA
jgi:microcystin-dependent protein